MYYGNDISTTEAKEEACENFFRFLLAKKLNEQPGNLKVLNCLTFNIVHIIYTFIYKYFHTFN